MVKKNKKEADKKQNSATKETEQTVDNQNE